MGCDIHTKIEVKKNGVWETYGDLDYEIGRDYELISVLANVRNDDAIPYISEPRGVPDDASEGYLELVEEWSGDGHSHSWVTLEDLEGFDIERTFFDSSLVLKRDESGKIVETCASTTGKHLGYVGKRKIFELWGREWWERLKGKLRSLEWDYEQGVRLVFFFDN